MKDTLFGSFFKVKGILMKNFIPVFLIVLFFLVSCTNEAHPIQTPEVVESGESTINHDTGTNTADEEIHNAPLDDENQTDETEKEILSDDSHLGERQKFEFIQTKEIPSFIQGTVETVYQEGHKLYVLVNDSEEPHFLRTYELGYVDLRDSSYHRLRTFEDRVWITDFIYRGDELIYSSIVPNHEEEVLDCQVIREIGDLREILHDGVVLWPMDAPTFVKVGDDIFYHFSQFIENEDHNFEFVDDFFKLGTEPKAILHYEVSMVSSEYRAVDFPEDYYAPHINIRANDRYVYYSKRSFYDSIIVVFDSITEEIMEFEVGGNITDYTIVGNKLFYFDATKEMYGNLSVQALDITTGEKLKLDSKIRDLSFDYVDQQGDVFILSYGVDAIVYYDAHRDIFERVRLKEVSPVISKTFNRYVKTKCYIEGDFIYLVLDMSESELKDFESGWMISTVKIK